MNKFLKIKSSTNTVFVSSHLEGLTSSAISSTGEVFTWGSNTHGLLGDGTKKSKSLPFNITSMFNLDSGDKITSLVLSTLHSIAISSTGKVFTWGSNSKGSLGNGTTEDEIVPKEITSNFSLIKGEKIISIFSGGLFSSAISSTGKVFTWGWNAKGQLGDGTIEDRHSPVDITSRFSLGSRDRIISLSLGAYHCIALSSQGRIYTWGENEWGQLGDGTTVNRNAPNEITSNFPFLKDDKIISLSLGGAESSAISTSGRIFTWGHNYFGQLGDGTDNKTFFYNRFKLGLLERFKSADKLLPNEITSNFRLKNKEKITLISINLGLITSFSAALSSTGRVFTWGANSKGELGDGTTIIRNLPNEITSKFSLKEGEKIISLSLGLDHSSAISSTGRLFTWGNNNTGQLGDGTTVDKNVPSLINI
jgi:alpha-tubulin suppressor-like RCC1 family protein